MNLQDWLLFSAVASLYILSPGPAVLFAISSSANHSLNRTFVSLVGNSTGLLMHSCAAILGLGAVVRVNPGLYDLLKFIGAGYLIYLGVRQWLDHSQGFSSITFKEAGQSWSRDHFIQGFGLAASNPKPLIFFTTLFPQFIRSEAIFAPQVIAYTMTFVLLSLVILMGYSVLGHGLKSFLANDRHMILIRRIIGATFILFGITLALS